VGNLVEGNPPFKTLGKNNSTKTKTQRKKKKTISKPISNTEILERKKKIRHS
jgi:hypothetical protein